MQFLLEILAVISFLCFSSSNGGTTSTSSNFPILFLGKETGKCGLDSPEIFYWAVVHPSLQDLHDESKGFFGILMDRLEESLVDLDAEDEESLEKQWTLIMETVQDSLSSVFQKIRRNWALFVAVSETKALPWEEKVKPLLLRELVTELEYHYVMVGAVIKAGVKEVVSSLQKQVAEAIRQLQSHVSSKNEEESEVGFLEKIDKALESQMDSSSFINKLLKRLIKRAIISKKATASETLEMNVFFSKFMEESALVFEAFRRKGEIFPKFWTDITQIVEAEIIETEKTNDVSHFQDLDTFVDNVYAILVSVIAIK